MKKLAACIAVGLLAVGAQSLMAQTNTNSFTPGTHAPGQHRPEGLLKLVGLTPADVKGLTPAERRAKIAQAANTVVAELQAKKANGTLTPEEQKRLTHLENFLAHANHPRNAAAPAD
ncbi:MAG: hypothetical protein ABSA83_18190 [Verrucomicrobiota bacterium]|jgi:hypothetical protein